MALNALSSEEDSVDGLVNTSLRSWSVAGYLYISAPADFVLPAPCGPDFRSKLVSLGLLRFQEEEAAKLGVSCIFGIRLLLSSVP